MQTKDGVPMDGLKQRMARRELTIGSWLSFGYPQTCEMMTRQGFDWLTVDMEHSAITDAEALTLIQITQSAGLDALVRVGANDPLLIKRAMDAGATGVIVPMVTTVEEAEAAVAAVYYPPRGQRGVGLSRAQGFGLGFDAYRDALDDTAVVVVQIEHYRGVENVEAILDVDGVDGFIVGPYDLSASLGKPGQFGDPEVQALLDRLGDVLQSHRKPGGYHVVHSDREALMRRVEMGARFVAYGTEMVFLAEKLREAGETIAAARAPGLDQGAPG